MSHPLGSLGLWQLEHRGPEKVGSLPKRRGGFDRNRLLLGTQLGGQGKDSRAGWLVLGPAIELYRAWANRRLGTLKSRAATALRGAELKHLQRSQPWSSPEPKPHPSTPHITESQPSELSKHDKLASAL